MRTILLISPYWKEAHRWMVSSVKLAELWQRLGFKVEVVCMGSETKTETVSDTLVIHHRRDVFLPDPLNAGISLGFAGATARLVRERKPDIIVINKVLFWSSLSMFRLRLMGKKVILLTDALVGMTWQPRGRLPKLIMTVAAWTGGWLVLLCAHKVVFFHPQPSRLLRFLGIAKRTLVIPTGIDPSPFTGVNAERAQVTVTYAGRLESVKGVDDFLAAVTPLKARFPELRIQVVGWYKDRHPLVEQYQREVCFTGLRHDMPAVFAETDIFVLPSYSEGLSNALMEAMSSGCACVASDVGGNRFLIQNGVSGFLFPAGDRAALRAHVQRLLEDPAKRTMLAAQAREDIETRFSWVRVGKQYQELFRHFHS